MILQNPSVTQDEIPLWAEDILRELHAVKKLLAQQQQNKQDDRGLYDFINVFREVMQANVQEGHYPEVELDGERIGVSFKKLLYNKSSGEVYERSKAFELYKALYRQHQSVKLF